MIVRLTAAVTRLLAGKDVIFKDLIEVYREARERGLKKKDDGGVFPPVARSAESVESWQAYEYEIGYMYLIKERENLAPIRLPDDIREDMKNRIRDVWRKTGGTGPVKLCCLYLRFERRESYTTRLRNSSSVETHLSAVRLLNEAGYQVLLTGDREMTPEIRKEFSGRFIDSDSISADKELFSLFAATEADILIGNNGGGITPALVNGTPGLYLDWFPFFMGYPNSWFYFKAASTEEGKMVPPEDLITKHAYDLSCSFGVLKNITSEEIRDAVACKISFLHLDTTDQECEAASIEFLWDRIVPGGIIVIDMFNLSSGYVGEYAPLFKRLGCSDGVIGTAHGQGIIFKQ
jgi:putative glycosyltransferase (TIGR04372 family)